MSDRGIGTLPDRREQSSHDDVFPSHQERDEESSLVGLTALTSEYNGDYLNAENVDTRELLASGSIQSTQSNINAAFPSLLPFVLDQHFRFVATIQPTFECYTSLAQHILTPWVETHHRKKSSHLRTTSWYSACRTSGSGRQL